MLQVRHQPTNIWAGPHLPSLFLFLSGCIGDLHTEHGLQAGGASVDPFTTFVILEREREKWGGCCS